LKASEEWWDNGWTIVKKIVLDSDGSPSVHFSNGYVISKNQFCKIRVHHPYDSKKSYKLEHYTVTPGVASDVTTRSDRMAVDVEKILQRLREKAPAFAYLLSGSQAGVRNCEEEGKQDNGAMNYDQTRMSQSTLTTTHQSHDWVKMNLPVTFSVAAGVAQVNVHSYAESKDDESVYIDCTLCLPDPNSFQIDKEHVKWYINQESAPWASRYIDRKPDAMKKICSKVLKYENRPFLLEEHNAYILRGLQQDDSDLICYSFNGLKLYNIEVEAKMEQILQDLDQEYNYSFSGDGLFQRATFPTLDFETIDKDVLLVQLSKSRMFEIRVDEWDTKHGNLDEEDANFLDSSISTTYESVEEGDVATCDSNTWLVLYTGAVLTEPNHDDCTLLVQDEAMVDEPDDKEGTTLTLMVPTPTPSTMNTESKEQPAVTPERKESPNRHVSEREEEGGIFPTGTTPTAVNPTTSTTLEDSTNQLKKTQKKDLPDVEDDDSESALDKPYAALTFEPNVYTKHHSWKIFQDGTRVMSDGGELMDISERPLVFCRNEITGKIKFVGEALWLAANHFFRKVVGCTLRNRTDGTLSETFWVNVREVVQTSSPSTLDRFAKYVLTTQEEKKELFSRFVPTCSPGECNSTDAYVDKGAGTSASTKDFVDTKLCLVVGCGYKSNKRRFDTIQFDMRNHMSAKHNATGGGDDSTDRKATDLPIDLTGGGRKKRRRTEQNDGDITHGAEDKTEELQKQLDESLAINSKMSQSAKTAANKQDRASKAGKKAIANAREEGVKKGLAQAKKEQHKVELEATTREHNEAQRQLLDKASILKTTAGAPTMLTKDIEHESVSRRQMQDRLKDQRKATKAHLKDMRKMVNCVKVEDVCKIMEIARGPSNATSEQTTEQRLTKLNTLTM
jgi:hypothetical protein